MGRGSTVNMKRTAKTYRVKSAGECIKAISEQEAGKPEKPPAAILDQAEYLAAHPVFVGGVHKSGTTLVRNLLDGHENLFVIPLDGKGLPWFENRLRKSTSLAEFVAETSRSMLYQLVSPNYKLPPYFILTGEAPEWESYRRFVRYYSHLIDRNGCTPEGALSAAMQAVYCVIAPPQGGSYKYFVEKTTLNIAWSMRIIHRFPHARFLDIERHPASVMASQKARQSLKRRRFNFLRELEYLRQMMDQSERARRAIGADYFHKVQYEHLVADTGEVMETICRFLDIPYRSSLLSPTVNGVPASANTGHGDMRWPAGSVKPRDVEKSHQNQDDAERRALESYLDLERHTSDGDYRPECLRFLSAIWALRRIYRADAWCAEPSLMRAAYMWLRYKRLPAARARISSMTS